MGRDRTQADAVLGPELLSIPPHDLEMEQAIRGGVLLEGESLSGLTAILTATDFYKEAHRVIFAAMCALFGRSEPIDVLTLSEELRRRGELESVGGPVALALMVDEAATSTNALVYAKYVRDKAVRREMIRQSLEAVKSSGTRRPPSARCWRGWKPKRRTRESCCAPVGGELGEETNFQPVKSRLPTFSLENPKRFAGCEPGILDGQAATAPCSCRRGSLLRTGHESRGLP